MVAGEGGRGQAERGMLAAAVKSVCVCVFFLLLLPATAPCFVDQIENGK